jgi:hypothetical protein
VKDPYGTVLVLLRDSSAVSAIVGSGSAAKVSNRAEAPPSVQIIDQVTTRRPTGLGSGSLGLQLWQAIARCFGPDAVGGDVTARQLAGAVSDELHGRKAVRGSTFLVRAYAPEIDGIFRDPDTKWPYYDVRLEIYAGT